jgi:DNA-binding CsgD family transcriptional regulator
MKGTSWNKSPRVGREILTVREAEILALVAVGVTNDEIAEKLGISPSTVKNHLYKIYKKIDAASRLQAALWAAKYL